jgi:hypothetical protein
MKTFKGKISNCRRISLTTDGSAYKPEIYGDNLGYIYQVDFLDHPVFRGLNALGGTTSLVVSEDDRGNVETLNSRYIKDGEVVPDNVW